MFKEKLNTWYLFGILIAVNFIFAFFLSQLLVTREIYYNTFQSQLDNTRIDEMFDMQSKFSWIGFAFLPLYLLLKIFVVSLTLQTGLLLCNAKLRFGTTFKITLIAEFVFLIPQLIKILWFLFAEKDYTLIDVQQFSPLSALNIFNAKNLSQFLIYPFQTFNVFEIFYWIILAGGIKQAFNTDINHGIKIVFSGYIPGLIIWIICIMFITVSLVPQT